MLNKGGDARRARGYDSVRRWMLALPISTESTISGVSGSSSCMSGLYANLSDLIWVHRYKKYTITSTTEVARLRSVILRAIVRSSEASLRVDYKGIVRA